MILTDEQILSSRLSFACCALAEATKAVDADIYGDKCADKYLRRAQWFSWAASVMCDTNTSTETTGCTDMDFAWEVYQKASCECEYKSCYTPPVPDCTLTPDIIVDGAAPFADLPADPDDGSTYYILSGTNAGEIATWDKDAVEYTYSSVEEGQSILDSSTGIYYTNIGSGPGLLFPNPILTNIALGYWSLSTDSPQTASGRTIQLQGLGPNGWYNLAAPINESQLAFLVNLTGLPFSDVRLKYTIDGCDYYSGLGSFVPPVVPPDLCTLTPDYTVAQAVDASQEGTLPSGRYLIVSDQFSMGNTWAAHVGDVVNDDGTFQPVQVAQIIYDISQEEYWWMTPAGIAPLFPGVTLTAVQSGYSIVSDYPAQSASTDRFIGIEGQVDGNWVIVWSGYEYDLPSEVSNFGPFTSVRVTYAYPNGCSYTVPGTVIQDTVIDVTSDCSEVEYFYYRYRDTTEGNNSWLFTAPDGETVTVTFWAGEIEPGGVVTIYDGPDNTYPIAGTNSGATDLAGLTFGSTGNQMFIEITQALADMPADFETWWWQMSCVPGSPAPAATVTTAAKCDEYELGISANITDLGGNAEVEIQYTVDGGPIEVIDGITTTGPVAVGSFPYQSEVIVYLVVTGDPLQSQVLGTFTGDPEVCVSPCIPEGNAKVDDQFDLSELPPEGLYDGWKVLISSDTQNIGTYPIGTALEWNLPPGEYVTFDYDPGVIGVGAPQTYWYSDGPGTQPYPLFPSGYLTPTGTSPNNFTIFFPDIQFYGIPTNTPVSLEVRIGYGPWQQVWTGTLQQGIVPLPISISQPFTNARLVYNYATCGLTSGVIIET